MNSPIEVDCLEEYISHIGDIAKSEKSHLYRGLEDVEWEVKSSVLRRLEGIYTGRLDLLPYVCWGYRIDLGYQHFFDNIEDRKLGKTSRRVGKPQIKPQHKYNSYSTSNIS